jgi:transcriptional regulator with XRE-family HTH domain
VENRYQILNELLLLELNKSNKEMNWIAKKISEARKIKGLTQEELAEQAKINLRTIQRIENSESEPRGKTLNLICEVLEIDSKELILMENTIQEKNIGTKIINGLFLFALNLVLMGIIGFLTLDSNANMNSVFGGYLVSVFLPFFIVTLTKKMSGIERMLKFGFGYLVYFVLVMVTHGFPTGFVTGLFPCLLISLSVLYFGNELIKNRE